MKKPLFLLMLMAWCAFAFGQTGSDKREVLSACFGMQELQSLYPVNNLGETSPLVVMEHGIEFSECHEVSFDGHQVNFFNKEEIVTSQIPAFFLFNTFEVSIESAKVQFSYYYNWTNPAVSPFDSPHIMIEGELMRDAAGHWYFTESKSERRNS